MSNLSNVHRILYVRTDRIGDVLMNLPAIRLLRQSYPKAWICLMTGQAAADLLGGHPDLDEIVTPESFDDEKIRKAKFDMALIANPAKGFHLKFFLAGIPVRVGYDRKWGFFLTHRLHAGQERLRRHEFENNLELVRLVSKKEWDGTYQLPPDAESLKRVSQKLKAADLTDRPVLAVHPGTSNPAKRWPCERFAEFLNRVLRERRFETVLIGGPEESHEAEKITAKLNAPVQNWIGKLSLKELSAFFHHGDVKALVSADSGPVHVAWMSGTPVVALYAKNDPGSSPARWGPRDGKSVTIYKNRDEISMEEVYEALKRIPEKN